MGVLGPAGGPSASFTPLLLREKKFEAISDRQSDWNSRKSLAFAGNQEGIGNDKHYINSIDRFAGGEHCLFIIIITNSCVTYDLMFFDIGRTIIDHSLIRTPRIKRYWKDRQSSADLRGDCMVRRAEAGTS